MRGVCILLMVIDHIMFDFAMLPDAIGGFYGKGENILTVLSDFANDHYWFETYRLVARVCVICLFLTLSGISSTLSRNNLLRGVKLAAAAIVLSLGSVAASDILGMDMTIIFGILHCLSISVFAYCLIKAIAGYSARYAFLAIGIVLIVWGLAINFYYLPQNLPMPSNLKEFADVILGLRYYGGDCFGIVPYTGVFLVGAYAGEAMYSSRESIAPKLDGKWNKPLMFVGRNTIWVYLLHQPAILLLLGILLTIFGYKIF